MTKLLPALMVLGVTACSPGASVAPAAREVHVANAAAQERAASADLGLALSNGDRLIVSGLHAATRGKMDGAADSACRYAADVGPFTTLRRVSAQGAVQWTWQSERDELLRVAPAIGESCLSPDRRYLLVQPVVPALGAEAADRMALLAIARLTKGAHRTNAPCLMRVRTLDGSAGLGDLHAALEGWKDGEPATPILSLRDGTTAEAKIETPSDCLP